jgi:fatty-acid peroxygenase
MAHFVTDRLTDATIALRRDPYRFISRRAAELGEDVVETRLLFRPTSCLIGAEAARVFYDPVRFQRAGAAPGALEKTLFGKGGVQGLDGEEHRERKAMFLEINRRDRVEALALIVQREWRAALERWSTAEEVDLYPQVQRLLTVAVCQWAGAPLPEEEVETRTSQLSALFDEAGTVGLGHLRSRAARRRAEAWAEQVIQSIRAGSGPVSKESAASIIAGHRDADGRRLAPRVAAVELLNVLRPTVATAVYIVFVAHALQAHPSWRKRLAGGDASEDLAFVEEVRRHYPFFSAVMAIVRKDFEWHGHRFPQGRRVLFDLYGTNHDPAVWRDPSQFDPERFLGADPDPFAFVPQGGGDPAVHHRCPGEPISTRVMVLALDQLTRRMMYTPVHPAGPVDFTRLPALPERGYRIRDVAPRYSDTGYPRVDRTSRGTSRP